MLPVQILSARLPTGEGCFVGVTLEPYVLIRKGEATYTAEDVPEEGTEAQGVPISIRTRWYRSTLPNTRTVCSVHPDKEATLQCAMCTRCKVATHLSYHCSSDCLKAHWHLHRDYHKQPTSTVVTHPSGIGAENGDKHRTSGDSSWVEVGRGRAYTPSSEDVGYVLKMEVSVVDKLTGIDPARTTQSAKTQRVRPAPNPPARSMVSLTPPAAEQSNAGRFTVLSYNVLADLFGKAEGFTSHCPAWLLHWHYRKKNLIRELLAYRPDILCLQEVQSDHYQDHWQPELAKAGYQAIYKKKTNDVFIQQNIYASDGCATFFRRDKFSLVKKYEVEFNKAAVSLAEGMANAQTKKAALQRLIKDNVALIAVLEASELMSPEAPPRRTLICVANTHIHANPELGDVKIWQVHTLLKGLEKIAASADIPMLVAGDFNSTPGSAAHCLLTKGKIDPPLLDAVPDPLELLKDPKMMMMSHTLPLSSACASLADAPLSADPRLHKQRQRIDKEHKEPLFTNITRDFRGTLDYICYTHTSLKPTAILELPTDTEVLGSSEMLPSAQYSSDHIALQAEFMLVK